VPIWKPNFDGTGTMVKYDYAKSADARWRSLIAGEISVKDLDDEEIARGQVRGAKGQFGRRPEWVPRLVFDAMRREIFTRGANLWSEYYMKAIKTTALIMVSPDVEPSVRLKAATEIINRIEGKPLDRSAIKITATRDEQVEAVGKAITVMLSALGHNIDDPRVREVAFAALNTVADAGKAPTPDRRIIEGE